MKGLLFTPEMARAVIAGRKTQTRRVVPGKLKLYEEGWSLDGQAPRTCDIDWCQYEPGTTVCLLTTWAVAEEFDHIRPSKLPKRAWRTLWHAGMTKRKPLANVPPLGRSRPGRFLPNAMRHLMPSLAITDVDVQRVRQISDADAIAEGIAEKYPGALAHYDDGSFSGGPSPSLVCHSPRRSFRSLWNSINAVRGKSWARNPQVFVIKFDVEIPF
jgi:hypothetical protein